MHHIKGKSKPVYQIMNLKMPLFLIKIIIFAMSNSDSLSLINNPILKKTKSSYHKFELVWAKVPGFSWWPGKIIAVPEKNSNVYSIIFSGDGSVYLYEYLVHTSNHKTYGHTFMEKNPLLIWGLHLLILKDRFNILKESFSMELWWWLTELIRWSKEKMMAKVSNKMGKKFLLPKRDQTWSKIKNKN